MALENRFKRPQTFICDDGGVEGAKFNNAHPTPFEGTLKSALLSKEIAKNDDAGVLGKNIVSAHEKPAGLNVQKTNDKKKIIYSVFREPKRTEYNQKISLFVRSVVSALDMPYEAAIKFLRDKAAVTSKHWYDVERAAASRAFWVAGATNQGLVDDFKQAVNKAISKGTSLAEFRKDFDKIVSKWQWVGWTGERSAKGRAWRTRIIYDTNLRAAYAAGRFAAMTREETLEVFPYWQYQHSGSSHPRLDHLSWDGLVLRADDPFWTTNYPPNGWHCGCYVTPVGEGALRRQGKREPDTAPERLPERRQVGGKQVTGIKGVDAGFEYNVGQEWLSRTAPGRETMAAAPGMIERFVAASLGDKIPLQTYMPAAIAPRKVASAFALPVKTELRLSADTIKRHVHHKEAVPEIYARLVEYAVSEGDFYVDVKGRVTALVDYDGHLWQIGLKKTAKGEIYVTTVHRSRENEKKRLVRHGKLIWKSGR